MGATVQMPDGALVQLPDNPSPQELQALQSIHDKATSGPAAVAEVGRVADKGLRGGVTAMPGLIGDTGTWGMGKLIDTAKSFLPDSVIPPVFRGADNSHFGDVTKGVQTAGGILPPVSEPQTPTGKAAGNVLESIISTLASGGTGTAGQKIATGAMSGAGGEAAAKIFGDNPVSRFLGSLGGGGAAALYQAHVPNADKLIKQNTAGMTDADWTKADSIGKVLDALGMDHLKSQLLGPRSTLDDVVATASSNPAVRPKLVTAVANVPGQTGQVVDDWASRNLPSSGANNRAEILQDVQGTATSAIKQMKDKSNDAFVAAMPPTGTTSTSGKDLHDALVSLANSDRFGASSDGGKALLKLADRLVTDRTLDTSGVNPTVLLRAQQAAKTSGQPLDLASLPGATTTPTFLDSSHQINNIAKELKLMATKEDFKGLPTKDAIALFNQYTPEFDAARAAKSNVMQSTVNPAQQGLAGQLAQMGGGIKADRQTATDRALNIVFPPTQPQGLAIHQLASDMGPDAVGELLREHVNKTLQQVLRGENKSPRSFVSAIYESPAQKENINAALEVLAQKQGRDPSDVKTGFQKLMDAMDSYKDMKMAVGVSPTATAEEAGQNLFSRVVQPFKAANRIGNQVVTEGTYSKIADLVTSKDGLQQLEAISKAPKSETLRQLLAGVLTSSSEAPTKGN